MRNHLADQLRKKPNVWAQLNDDPPPYPEFPHIPAREVLETAREIWEARGRWAPLGAFNVVIRNNILYAMFRSVPNSAEKIGSYHHGECFECGRPADFLSRAYATKLCQACALDFISAEPEELSLLMALDPDQVRDWAGYQR
jgi:hypothetical protein